MSGDGFRRVIRAKRKARGMSTVQSERPSCQTCGFNVEARMTKGRWCIGPVPVAECVQLGRKHWKPADKINAALEDSEGRG